MEAPLDGAAVLANRSAAGRCSCQNVCNHRMGRLFVCSAPRGVRMSVGVSTTRWCRCQLVQAPLDDVAVSAGRRPRHSAVIRRLEDEYSHFPIDNFGLGPFVI